MTHPHQSMLDELSFAIKHFVPTVPQEVITQAVEKLKELSANAEANEEVIKNAFHDIGLQEYPHRKAYEELTHTSAEQKMKDMVIEHVDETVRGVIKSHLDAGVSLEELVNSEIFEGQLDPKQRYQVEDGILVATDKLAESLRGDVSDHGDDYKRLLEKWTKHVQEIHTQIDKLDALTPGGTEEQGLEISNKVRSFREGFLLTERDPELEEVKKEVEYWTDTFAEEEE
ncbi:MAG: hypothetical protein HQ488_04275 [Parcubacteria group bacterium]|nr:hypothetical protein [Parcubacteria group bacterium]